MVIILYQRGKPHDSDSRVEMHYGLVYTIKDGLVRRCDFYARPEDALGAAGLQK